MVKISSIFITMVFAMMIQSCKAPNFEDVIQGNWGSFEEPLFLSFSGDSVSYAMGNMQVPTGGRHRHPIVNQTSLVPTKWMRYKIQSSILFVPDTLGGQFRELAIIKYINDSLGIFLRRAQEPIVLHRLQYDSTLLLKEIQLTTTGCYYTCPIFDLKLDPHDIFFNGERYTAIDGLNMRSLSQAEFDEIQHLARIAVSIDNNKQIQERAQHWSDAWDFSLLIKTNTRTVSYRFNAMEYPGQVSPLLAKLMPFPMTRSFTKIDTLFPFESRLAMCYSLNDSLEYLEQFFPKQYRPVRFPGGVKRLSRLFRQQFNPASFIDEEMYFEVTIDERGRPRSIDVGNIKLENHKESLWTAISRLPAWVPAISNGKYTVAKTRAYISPTQ